MTKIPTGVKVISVLYYISAALLLLIGLTLVLASKPLTSALAPLADQAGIPLLATISIWAVIGIGVAYLLIAALDFFIAKGLMKAQSWSRIVVIIIAGISFLSAIMGLIDGSYLSAVPSLIFNGAIGGYLLFSNKVKKAFS